MFSNPLVILSQIELLRLWSELTGEKPVNGDNMPGILCPSCFDKIASRRGIMLRWIPTRCEQ